MCVCMSRQENLSSVSALMVRGERGGKVSHPLCSFMPLSSLLTNLLSSRHSQDLNDP